MIDESEFLELATVFGFNKGPVSISGVLGAGNVLTFALRPGYTAAGQQWTRTTNGVTSDISGQTATTYTQLPSDRGSTIGCRAFGLAYSANAGAVPITAPGAPTIASISAGNGSVTATITDNADNGGAVVTDHRLYVYRTANDELLAQANGASPLAVTGLPNGTQVYAQAASINSVGVGGKSAKSANVTPATSTAAPMVSMAVRARAATGAGQLPVGNPYLNWRIIEKANNPGRILRGNFWNAISVPTVQGRMQDVAGVSPCSLGVSYITGVDGSSNLDQSAGILYTPTWNDAANGVAGKIMRLDKSTPTAAEFLAAGGSLAGGGTRIIIPPGMFVEHDDLVLPADLVGRFAVQLEIGGASSCTFNVTNAGTYIAGTPIAVTTASGVPVVGWKYGMSGAGVVTTPTSGVNMGMTTLEPLVPIPRVSSRCLKTSQRQPAKSLPPARDIRSRASYPARRSATLPRKVLSTSV